MPPCFADRSASCLDELADSLDDRAIHRDDDSAFFQAFGVFLVIGIAREFATVFLVFGQRRKLDESERLVGGAGEFRRQEVADDVAATAADRLKLGCGVGLEISNLVWVERVTD